MHEKDKKKKLELGNMKIQLENKTMRKQKRRERKEMEAHERPNVKLAVGLKGDDNTGKQKTQARRAGNTKIGARKRKERKSVVVI